MNRKYVVSHTLVLAVGILLGVIVPVFAHSVGSKVTNLFNSPLTDELSPGREVIVDLVEIPPNGKLDWHWHPGEEFHYYLEGNPIIERRDAAPIIGKIGSVGHVKYGSLHQASAGDLGAKILVFRVHTTGKPWRYLESEGRKSVEP